MHGFLQNDGILVGKLRHFSESGKLSNITDATSGTFNFTKKNIAFIERKAQATL